MGEPCLPLVARLLSPIPSKPALLLSENFFASSAKKGFGMRAQLSDPDRKPGNRDPLIAWSFPWVAGCHTSQLEKKKERGGGGMQTPQAP